MKLATTTADFAPYVKYPECVKLIHDAGFRYIDIGIGRNPVWYEDGWEDFAKRLRDYAESLDMKFIQAHSPEGNPMDLEKQERLVWRTNRSIEVCEILGVPQTVVHTGWKSNVTEEEYFEQNYDFLKKLFPTMEKTGVNVLIENSTKTNLGNATLYQLSGSLNNVPGRFEWIVQNGNVTHRMIIKGGGINGIPIMP